VIRKKRDTGESSTWGAIYARDAVNGLSRERIVAAAIALADQHGLPAVSIRKVAAELGSSPMALYHYVPNKRDLLNLMLDATCEEFQWPSETFGAWRDALSHFAWESRRRLQRHAWISVLSADAPEYGPECIRIFEAVLTSLSHFGLDMRTATRGLGALFVFVNGFVAAETTSGSGLRHPRQRRSRAPLPVFSRAVLATGKFPHVARFVEAGSELPDDEAFRRALNWILNGMASDFQPVLLRHSGSNIKKPN